MDLFYFYAGVAGIIIGVLGTVVSFLRTVEGVISPWRATVNSMYGLGTAAVGYYLFSDSRILLLVGIVLMIAAGFLSARMERIQQKDS